MRETKDNRIIKIIFDALCQIDKNKAPKMSPHFHYIDIPGCGLGFNDWNIQTGITNKLSTIDDVITYYKKQIDSYKEFPKTLFIVSKELDKYFQINPIFFSSLFQAMYLFAVNGEKVGNKKNAKEFLLFIKWFHKNFANEITFPAPTPLFIGYAYPADIIDEKVDTFFTNLKLKLLSFKIFFPKQEILFIPFHDKSKKITLLNLAMTGDTCRHTEYIAQIGKTDFYFRFKLGHTDCGGGFYLNISYLPFGYAAKKYSQELRRSDASPDIFCKTGGEFSLIDESFRIKNIQGGYQFGFQATREVSLETREEFFLSEIFHKLLNKFQRLGVKYSLGEKKLYLEKFSSDDLNLFFVSKEYFRAVKNIIGSWHQEFENQLKKVGLKIYDDIIFKHIVEDKPYSNKLPEKIGFRLGQGSIFQYFKKEFGDISPFDLVLLKFCQIIYNCPGIQANRKVFYPQYFKICTSKLNRWTNHSLGRKKYYQEMYDKRARQLGFQEKDNWYTLPFTNFSNLISNVIESNTNNLYTDKQKNIIKQTVERFLKIDNFQPFHFSDRLKSVKGYKF